MQSCLECYVNYTIIEGKELIGNLYTTTAGVNVGPVGCVPKGESGGWHLFFTPLSPGNITVIISYEGRYQEWGEAKVCRPPESEIALHLVPREKPGYSGGFIMLGILAAALVMALGVKIRSSRRKLVTAANLPARPDDAQPSHAG